MSKPHGSNAAHQISIRMAEDTDFLSLRRFFVAHYPPDAPQRDPKRWDYLFRYGPCEAWVAESPAQAVVGHMSALPVVLDVAGNERRSAWIFNIMVNPAWRHQGIASRMARSIQDYYGSAAVLGANESSRGLLVASNWAQLPDVPRHVMITNPKYYARRALTQRRPKATVRDLLIAAQGALIQPRTRAVSPGLRTERIARFDSAVNTLYSRLAPTFRLIARRNADLLNWRFVDRSKFKLCLLQAYPKRELGGYIVFGAMSRNGERIGVIVDWLYDLQEPQIGRVLLRECIAMLSRIDVHRIEAWIFPSPMRRVLESHGFRKWPKGRLWLVDGSLAAALENTRNTLFEWHLTLGDSNLDEEVFLGGFAETEDFAILDVGSGSQESEAD